MITRSTFSMIVAAMALILSGCGGGGGGSSAGTPSSGASTALSGTAATGAGLVGTVTVTDSNLTVRSVSTDSNGNYSINVSGLAAPFVLRIQATLGSRTYDYYAPATTEDIGGTINITPLSDLMLANLATDIAANCAVSNACIAALTKANIDIQIGNLRTLLEPTLTALGISASADLLRAPFTAGSHTGVDALLDVLNVNLDTATKIATITNVVSGSSVTNDVATGSSSGTLAAGTTDTSTAGMVAAVRARIAEMDAIIASSADIPTRTSQLEAFCTGDFLLRNHSCNTIMGYFASSQYPFGSYVERFGKFDQTADDGVDSSAPMDDQHVGVITAEDSRTAWLWRRNAGDGKYYLAGDQMTGDYILTADHQWDGNAGTGSSGIDTTVEPVAANGTTMTADSATIAGPGLGSTVPLTQNPGETRLVVDYGIGSFGSWIRESDYTLADVQAGVAAKSAYTLTLKLMGNTVATYRRTLKVAPLASGSLTESMFPYVTNPPSVADCNGSNWVPAYVTRGYSIASTRVECSDGANIASESYEDAQAPSLTMPNIASPTQVTVFISGIDNATGRYFTWKKAFN